MAKRFNPPPGWPPAPAGWVAPPDWQPDPSWPAPPAGWQLWIEDLPIMSQAAPGSFLAVAGGTAIVGGSLMPFVSFSGMAGEVNPDAKAMSIVFGLIVMTLGCALHTAPQTKRLGVGIATLCLAAAATLGYAGFIGVGIIGVQEQDLFGDTTRMTFAPDIGIILCLAGCVAACVAAIQSLQRRQP